MTEKQEVAQTIKHLAASLEAEVAKAQALGLTVAVHSPRQHQLGLGGPALQVRVSEVLA